MSLAHVSRIQQARPSSSSPSAYLNTSIGGPGRHLHLPRLLQYVGGGLDHGCVEHALAEVCDDGGARPARLRPSGNPARTMTCSPAPLGEISVYESSSPAISIAHGSTSPVRGSTQPSRSTPQKGSEAVKTNPMPSWPASRLAFRASEGVPHVAASPQLARAPVDGEYGTLVGLPSRPLASRRQHTHWRRSLMPGAPLTPTSWQRRPGALPGGPYASRGGPAGLPHAFERDHRRLLWRPGHGVPPLSLAPSFCNVSSRKRSISSSVSPARCPVRTVSLTASSKGSRR